MVYHCIVAPRVSLLSPSIFRFVVLVSGLNIGSAWFDQLSIQMLVDYITGQAGGPQVSNIAYSYACGLSHAPRRVWSGSLKYPQITIIQ